MVLIFTDNYLNFSTVRTFLYIKIFKVYAGHVEEHSIYDCFLKDKSSTEATFSSASNFGSY